MNYKYIHYHVISGFRHSVNEIYTHVWEAEDVLEEGAAEEIWA
jgi:hypothetical protein